MKNLAIDVALKIPIFCASLHISIGMISNEKPYKGAHLTGFPETIFGPGSKNKKRIKKLTVKNDVIFSRKTVFLLFGEIEKWNFLTSTLKNFLYFRKLNFLVSYFSYITGNGTFLYFGKWAFIVSCFSYNPRGNFLSSKI